MIFGLIFIIMFISGIILMVIGLNKDNDLLWILGLPCMLGGLFGIIAFICINIETLIKWLTI